MQSLFVRQLYLWPRFHANVSKCLEKRPPEVVEMHVSLSPTMKKIQNAVIELIGVCLNDLKEGNQVSLSSSPGDPTDP